MRGRASVVLSGGSRPSVNSPVPATPRGAAPLLTLSGLPGMLGGRSGLHLLIWPTGRLPRRPRTGWEALSPGPHDGPAGERMRVAPLPCRLPVCCGLIPSHVALGKRGQRPSWVAPSLRTRVKKNGNPNRWEVSHCSVRLKGLAGASRGEEEESPSVGFSVCVPMRSMRQLSPSANDRFAAKVLLLCRSGVWTLTMFTLGAI